MTEKQREELRAKVVAIACATFGDAIPISREDIEGLDEIVDEIYDICCPPIRHGKEADKHPLTPCIYCGRELVREATVYYETARGNVCGKCKI